MTAGLEQVERYQFVGLAAVLVGVLFVHPYVATGRDDLLWIVLLALIPAMAVVALVKHRVMAVVGLILGIPATVAILNPRLGEPLGNGPLIALAPLAFYVFATGVICYHVVTERSVRRDTLLGAMCGYLMLGYTWSVAYATLMSYEPASFYTAHGNVHAMPSDVFYLSFVTLSTLGYGDIVPLTAKARSLAMMESITGVLYLAVLVSRLVAMYGAGDDRD